MIFSDTLDMYQHRRRQHEHKRRTTTVELWLTFDAHDADTGLVWQQHPRCNTPKAFRRRTQFVTIGVTHAYMQKLSTTHAHAPLETRVVS